MVRRLLSSLSTPFVNCVLHFSEQSGLMVCILLIRVFLSLSNGPAGCDPGYQNLLSGMLGERERVSGDLSSRTAFAGLSISGLSGFLEAGNFFPPAERR